MLEETYFLLWNTIEDVLTNVNAAFSDVMKEASVTAVNSHKCSTVCYLCKTEVFKSAEFLAEDKLKCIQLKINISIIKIPKISKLKSPKVHLKTVS